MCRRLFTRPFPTLSFSLSSRPLRTALLRACSRHAFLLLSADDLAPRVLLASRISLSCRLLSHRLTLSPRGRCAHHFSRCSASRLSPLASRRLFARAFPTRSFSTPRCLYKEACLACSLCTFVRALHSLSLSLRSALLRSASLVLLLSCLAFSLSLSLFVPRPLLSSRLDTPHHLSYMSSL